MIRIHNIKLPLNSTPAQLKQAAAEKLKINAEKIIGLRIVKKSTDARRKKQIHTVYSVNCRLDDESGICFGPDVESAAADEVYSPAKVSRPAMKVRPVVVGTGPAGMMAALALAEAGLKPLVLERGREVGQRKKDVDAFWQTGNLDIVSNVQFGEGGAGTFSDGKLMTGIKKDKYVRKVFAEFVEAGAPEEILYLAKPHIGTDKLVQMVRNIRLKIERLGGEYLFEHKLCGLTAKAGNLKAIKVENNRGEALQIACESLILAVGHSARDTFEMLFGQGVEMVQKPFSVGARIEHRQALINKAQYGREQLPGLGAADYKLAVHLPGGRSVYTFCMCPGGYVVAAASEAGRVVTNGMSTYARSGENANAALLVNVGEADFQSKHPLAGMYFQQKIEERAFAAGGGNYKAPAQLSGDFRQNRESRRLGGVMPSYRPGVALSAIQNVLPEAVAGAIRAAIGEMDKKLPGFAAYDAVLTAPETRSSSPVRIIRDHTMQSSIKGLYPCGEGAGYAGGITSAAADGLRAAEALAAAWDCPGGD